MPEGQLGSVTLDFPYPTFSWTQQKSAEHGAVCGKPGAWQPVPLLLGTLRTGPGLIATGSLSPTQPQTLWSCSAAEIESVWDKKPLEKSQDKAQSVSSLSRHSFLAAPGAKIETKVLNVLNHIFPSPCMKSKPTQRLEPLYPISPPHPSSLWCGWAFLSHQASPGTLRQLPPPSEGPAQKPSCGVSSP